MKSLFLSFLFSLSLFAFNVCVTVPTAYKNISEDIEVERVVYHDLLLDLRYERHQGDIDEYFYAVSKVYAIGNHLDDEIHSANPDLKKEKELKSSFLKSLRSLAKSSKYLKHVYFLELSNAMKEKDDEYVIFLVTKAAMILSENEKLKTEVIEYSYKHKKVQQYSAVQYLLDEQNLNEKSRAYTQKMQEEYMAYQEVLKLIEAEKLRALLVAKKKGGVIVYAKEKDGDINFIIENLFLMHVSVNLHVENIVGYKSDGNLHVETVLKAKEKKTILTLKNTSKDKKVGSFDSHLSWSKGAVGFKPDLDYIYALPFKDLQKVSQGFNGKTSHRGTAKYAVDFALALGTEVLAAREGKIVEIVQSHNKHGMSLDMRKFANYVIIEHSDKTLARYFHLKQNAVNVKIGQMVNKGDLIALSGDTGRTSGPHLHFVVTKAEIYHDGYRSVSVSIRFLCSDGVENDMVSGKSYCP